MPSMFTDQEFAELKQLFEKNNPALAQDPQGIRAKIGEIDQQIAKLQHEHPEGCGFAVCILAQGRNFFARYLGEPEIATPMLKGASLAPAAIESKHVAIFIPEGDTLRRAIEQVLQTTRPDLRFKCYEKMGELLDALQKGEVCGAIGLFLQPDGHPSRLEGVIRHDLKNKTGWDIVKVQHFALPPCASFGPPHLLTNLLEAALQMQKGEYQAPKPKDENFVLSDHLSRLSAHMFVPPRQIRVAVVDDEEAAVWGLKIILRSWLNLDLQVYSPGTQDTLEAEQGPDILLLDEVMSPISGTEFARLFMDQGYRGIIASISGGAKPGYTQLHFPHKLAVSKSYAAALEFVNFMNSLLGKLF